MMNKQITRQELMPWLVWGVSVAFYFYVFILQVTINVMAPNLMHTFHVDATAIGSLAAYYFYIYGGLQIPVGVLTDYFGVRKLMTMAIAICAIGSLLFALANSFFLIEISRFLIGIGTAFGLVCSLTLAASWFAPRYFAILLGLLTMIGTLGGGFGNGVLALLIAGIGWRDTSIIIAVIGIVLSILSWLLVRDHPVDLSSNEGLDDLVLQKTSLWAGLKHVLYKRQNWYYGIYAGCVYFPTIIFGTLLGIPFLMQVYGLSQHAAAGLISMIYIGWAIGGPCFGWLFERTHYKRTLIGVAAAILLVSVLIFVYVPHLTIVQLVILLFILGFFSNGEALIFVFAREGNSARYIGTSIGFVNFLCVIAGGFFPLIMGATLDHHWGGVINHGIRHYSAYAYHIAFSIVPILALLGVLIVFCFQPLRRS